jgi:hypothetical protein
MRPLITTLPGHPLKRTKPLDASAAWLDAPHPFGHEKLSSAQRVSYSRYERPEAREPDTGILQYSEEGDRRFGARSRL